MKARIPPLHIAIRHLEYMAGSREQPELGVLVQTHAGRPPVPWGQISPGEEVRLKLANGPVVASATVEGFRQLGDASAKQLRPLTIGFGLYRLDEYWSKLPARFSGMAIYLTDERWYDDAYVPGARSRGGSWIVLIGKERDAWERGGVAAEVERARAPVRGSTSVGLRFLVLRRDGFRCTYCGRSAQDVGVRLHVDHIVPVAHDGLTLVENLRTACIECNLGKGTRSPIL